MPFPFHMLMPFCFNKSAFVCPRINHNNYSHTPRQNTRLVVSNGRRLSRSENFIINPNMLRVPTPVRSLFAIPSLIIFCIRFKYCYSSAFRLTYLTISYYSPFSALICLPFVLSQIHYMLASYIFVLSVDISCIYSNLLHSQPSVILVTSCRN